MIDPKLNSGNVVRVEFGYGEPVFGLWCDKCLKPGAYMVEVYGLFVAGVSHLGIWQGCADCGDWAKYVET